MDSEAHLERSLMSMVPVAFCSRLYIAVLLTALLSLTPGTASQVRNAVEPGML